MIGLLNGYDSKGMKGGFVQPVCYGYQAAFAEGKRGREKDHRATDREFR